MSGREQDRFEALAGVVAFLATVKEADDDRVWARVTEKLAAALDCPAATYFTYLPKTEELAARAAVGPARKLVESRRVAVGQGLCGWVGQYREPLVVNDPRSDDRFLKDFDAETGFKTERVLAVPLFDRLEMTGVVELLNKRGGPFDSADVALVAAACSAASMCLRALRLESTVERVTAHNASILENLGGGFVAIDARGRLMLCNPAAKKILGLPEDLPLGRPAEESLAAVPGMAEILVGTLKSKETVKRRDLPWTRAGETRVLGYSTLMIQDPRGQVVGAGITFQDITQFQKK